MDENCALRALPARVPVGVRLSSHENRTRVLRPLVFSLFLCVRVSRLSLASFCLPHFPSYTPEYMTLSSLHTIHHGMYVCITSTWSFSSLLAHKWACFSCFVCCARLLSTLLFFGWCFLFLLFFPSLSLCVCFVCTLGCSLVRAWVCVFFVACFCLFLCRCFGF